MRLVQPWRERYPAFNFAQISFLCRASRLMQGRFAIVTNVEAGSGGRKTSQHSLSDADERGLADGEAVWSWRPDAGVKLATMSAHH